LDIAISREHQGTGLAQLMFHEYSSLLLSRGVRQFTITTGGALVRAQRFYERLGAVRACAIEIHKGEGTVMYTYTIPDSVG
jgi:GNAT superfamily N-acetyltransferase